MTPEDAELWKQVTEGKVPLAFTPAAAIRLRARWQSAMGQRCHTLDLHGMTLNEAHAETRRLVREARLLGLKSVTVITGLSGGIRREFPFWAEALPEVRSFTPLNGGGAFKLQIVRPKT